jgi:protein ImuB
MPSHPARRILSLWFPRLGAERLVRAGAGSADTPFATVAEVGNTRVLASLTAAASAAGLARGQPLRDAFALCPGLVTRPADPAREAAFLSALRRWAGRFSPWVAEEAPDGLVIDLTGCAHLWGGEAALVAEVMGDCADLGLTVCPGLADTLGAAWALARYAGQGVAPARSGDAIDQEAHATRSRAAKRHRWERGGTPLRGGVSAAAGRICPPGGTGAALAPLPIAALRVDEATVAALAQVGLRRVGDLTGMPRAALARRYGLHLIRQLDRATGAEPEPVAPAEAERPFAVRMAFPEPIGLMDDLLAALDRLLPALGERLQARGRGARTVEVQAGRVDGETAVVRVGLAQATADPARVRPLLAMKLDGLDAGFGFDRLRLVAVLTEPVHARQLAGQVAATDAALARAAAGPGLDDLIGRLGARVGLEAITRMHPADSHIPEKGFAVLAAAWSDPAPVPWPWPPRPRPLLLWRPEPVAAPDAVGGGDAPPQPALFRWRGRDHRAVAWEGPERLAPEWWLDDPDWRSGVRDYWQVTVATGERLWLFHAHGGERSGGWFCQGVFA